MMMSTVTFGMARDSFTTAHPIYMHPQHFFGQTLSLDESWLADGINYPHLPTVYGPLWILFGALGWLLTPTSLIGWKLLSILFEAVCLVSARAWWDSRALVAWITCPLWFWETMLQCHAEVFGVGFFVLALGAIRQRQFLRAGFLLALALGGRWSFIAATVNDSGLCEGGVYHAAKSYFRIQSRGFISRVSLWCHGAVQYRWT